ncbi:DUF1343 domain-containing protein [Candidatus Dependentiae bacterium]|nr:DUF1343 domain-containing protein [Candidatus Dependentiae bacterium]
MKKTIRALVIGGLLIAVPETNRLYAPEKFVDAQILYQAERLLQLGIENLTDRLREIARLEQGPLNIGLITNQTGIDQQGNRNIKILLDAGFNITRLYAPEHGIDGTVLADDQPGDMVDREIPVITMYRVAGGMKEFTAQELAAIDAFFFDMQDSGMRHYTYLSTLVKVMELASKHDKALIVFDRPNPLGSLMEGPLVDKEYQSFISIIPVPVRHGMTLGELAEFVNRHILKKQVRLHVVPMKNYFRTMKNPPFLTFLSPNITSYASCKGYSFLGLLGEIEPFDVGVGTDKAFQVIMLPESLPATKQFFAQLATRLAAMGIASEPYQTVKERAGNLPLHGLHLTIADVTKQSGLQALIEVIDLAKKYDLPIKPKVQLDKAFGTDILSKYIKGEMARAEFIKRCNADLKEFFAKARTSFMYEPLPTVHFLR